MGGKEKERHGGEQPFYRLDHRPGGREADDRRKMELAIEPPEEKQ